MPSRPKYSEAPTMRDHYHSIAEQLTKHQQDIQSILVSAGSMDASLFVSSDICGDYYDTYCNKKDEWIEQHNQIIAKFDGFMTGLNTCIENAKNLEFMWEERISIMEEY